jgi:hypothetical protein
VPSWVVQSNCGWAGRAAERSSGSRRRFPHRLSRDVTHGVQAAHTSRRAPARWLGVNGSMSARKPSYAGVSVSTAHSRDGSGHERWEQRSRRQRRQPGLKTAGEVRAGSRRGPCQGSREDNHAADNGRYRNTPFRIRFLRRSGRRRTDRDGPGASDNGDLADHGVHSYRVRA